MYWFLGLFGGRKEGQEIDRSGSIFCKFWEQVLLTLGLCRGPFSDVFGIIFRPDLDLQIGGFTGVRYSHVRTMPFCMFNVNECLLKELILCLVLSKAF